MPVKTTVLFLSMLVAALCGSAPAGEEDPTPWPGHGASWRKQPWQNWPGQEQPWHRFPGQKHPGAASGSPSMAGNWGGGIADMGGQVKTLVIEARPKKD